MEELITYRQELLAALEADITTLARIETSFSSQDWYCPLGGDHSTPHFTLARIWAEDAHGFAPQIRRILDEEKPLLSVFDAEAWLADHYDPEEPARIIIENFASLRTWELGLLCGLAPASWSRTARDPRWGVHTLQWWVELQRNFSHQHLSLLIPLLNL
jgi:hypothetical protein